MKILKALKNETDFAVANPRPGRRNEKIGNFVSFFSE